MPGQLLNPVLPLPRQWSRRIRSAIIHAISLANFALTFGAVGKHDSLSVIERLIRSIKNECTHQLLVPYDRMELRQELSLFVDWYNGLRPHSTFETRISRIDVGDTK